MAVDPEINAMESVATALGDLDADARSRVLEWAARKYGLAIQSDVAQPIGRNAPGGPRGLPSEIHAEFVDLFDSANPQTDADKALVGGYWFQVEQTNASFDAQQVNEALKDVGHGIGNITRALTSLQDCKPALVRQIAKSGKSQQARKSYKVTTSGQDKVRRLIAGEADPGSA